MLVVLLAGQGEGHTVVIVVARIFLGGGGRPALLYNFVFYSETQKGLF